MPKMRQLCKSCVVGMAAAVSSRLHVYVCMLYCFLMEYYILGTITTYVYNDCSMNERYEVLTI